MFDLIRNNRKFAQAVLALIMLPLGIFGIDAYFRNGSAGDGVVAKVGRQEIPQAEFDQALRLQTDRLRQQMGDGFNSSMAESREFRASVLERLINEKLLARALAEGRISLPDAYLQKQIQAMPEFQENGHFSMRLYEALLRGQGYSPAAFEFGKRQDLEKQVLFYSLMGTDRAPGLIASRLLSLNGEERQVSSWNFDAKSREVGVKLAPETAKKFYTENAARFREPEQAKLEYIVLSAEELGAGVEVSDADAQKFYEEHKKDYTQPEERRVSHILFEVGKTASADVKAAAKKKAEDVLAKLKANPARFAELAKANSDDKVSAEKGGDLGFFQRGKMTDAFDSAAFGLKPKEISGLVQTEFGFHILRLEETRGGSVKAFADLKKDIVAELRRQAGAKRYAEIGEQFGNMVFEEPDALKPIAEKLGLKLQTTDWVSPVSVSSPVLSHPKLRSLIFSDELVKSRRNSEAIDLGKNVSVSVRVLDYKPARNKSFEEVKAEVELLAKAQEAAKLAKQEGEAVLAKLKSSGAAEGAKWEAAKGVKRSDPLPIETKRAIFAASANKLPAYVGMESDAGYTIFRVEKVKEEKLEASDPRIKQLSERYAAELGQEDFRAYLQALNKRFGVKTDETKLMAKSQ